MSADAEAVRAVVSWACGFLTLGLIGVVVPVLLSFVPDAIGLWRLRGQRQPALIFVGLVAGVLVLAGYEVTLTGTPGTPSSVLWMTLSILLGVGVGVAAFCFAVSRAIRRRTDHRRALDLATAPPSSNTEPAASGKPVAVARLDARAAEFLARDWMRHLGAAEAVETRERRDGGIDVRSRDFVAQVKHLQNEQVGVAAVRQLVGVASAEQRGALFFSSSGYTRDALAFARENEVALFVVRYREGRLVPHGALAQRYLSHGLQTLPQRL